MRMRLVSVRRYGQFLDWQSPSWFRRGWRGWLFSYYSGHYGLEISLLGFIWIWSWV
jgi:hypothetical protein